MDETLALNTRVLDAMGLDKFTHFTHIKADAQ